MPRKYPPLTPDDVKAILRAKGFEHVRTKSDHEQWRGFIRNLQRVVTVDVGYDQFSVERIQDIISQSGLTREEFYGATKRTAKKIGRKR